MALRDILPAYSLPALLYPVPTLEPASEDRVSSIVQLCYHLNDQVLLSQIHCDSNHLNYPPIILADALNITETNVSNCIILYRSYADLQNAIIDHLQQNILLLKQRTVTANDDDDDVMGYNVMLEQYNEFVSPYLDEEVTIYENTNAVNTVHTVTESMHNIVQIKQSTAEVVGSSTHPIDSFLLKARCLSGIFTCVTMLLIVSQAQSVHLFSTTAPGINNADFNVSI